MELTNLLPSSTGQGSGSGGILELPAPVSITLPFSVEEGEAVFLNNFGEYRKFSDLKDTNTVLLSLGSRPNTLTHKQDETANSGIIMTLFPGTAVSKCYSQARSTASPFDTKLEAIYYLVRLSDGLLVLCHFQVTTSSFYILSQDGKTLLAARTVASAAIHAGNTSGGHGVIGVRPGTSNDILVYSETSNGTNYIYTINKFSINTSTYVISNSANSYNAFNGTGRITRNVSPINADRNYSGVDATTLRRVLFSSHNTTPATISSVPTLYTSSSNTLIQTVTVGDYDILFRSGLTTAGAPIVINRTTNALVTTGLPTALTSNYTAPTVVSLDSTNILILSSNSLKLVTLASDGISSSNSQDILSITAATLSGCIKYRGRYYALLGTNTAQDRLSTGATSFYGDNYSIVAFDYSSGSITNVVSYTSDQYSQLLEIVPLMPIVRSMWLEHTNLVDLDINNKAMAPIITWATELSTQTSVVIHSFDLDFQLKRIPIPVGYATETVAANTATTLYLPENALKYQGAQINQKYWSGEYVGIHSNYILRIKDYQIPLKVEDYFYQTIGSTQDLLTIPGSINVFRASNTPTASRVYLGSFLELNSSKYNKLTCLFSEKRSTQGSRSSSLFISGGNTLLSISNAIPASSAGITKMKLTPSWPVLFAYSVTDTSAPGSYIALLDIEENV